MATPKDGRSFAERNENNYLEDVSQTSLAQDSELLKDQFADLTRIPDDLIKQSKTIEDFLNSRQLRDSDADFEEQDANSSLHQSSETKKKSGSSDAVFETTEKE